MFSKLRALKRDLASLTSSLTGSKPASAAATRPAAARGPSRMRVAAVVRETADALTLVLEDAGGQPVRFAPGQFFTLVVPVGGQSIRRAYSACSDAAQSASVSVTIKRTPDGKVSRHLVENARAGDVYEVLGPSGSFTPAPSAAPRRLVLVGGGSGITPLMAIARTLLPAEPETRIDLVYGNRGIDDVIFREALEALAASHAPRLRVRHVLQHPPAGWPSPGGLLDGEALARELDALGEADAPTTEYFICGPEPMMRAARELLEGRGIDRARVHQESFAAAHPTAANTPTAPQPVTVLLYGEQHEVVVHPPHTVLEAALEAKVEMPYSCTVGGCGTCRVRLVEGKVVMEEPNCLNDQERARGYVLACVSRPTTPCTLEVE